MSGPTRRDLLTAGLALSGLPLLELGCGAAPTPHGQREIDPDAYDLARTTAFDPLAIAEDAAAFALGVQAGEMTNAGALLWVHDAGAGPLRLRVWRELPERPGQVALVHDLPASPGPGGYTKLAVGGLAPATWYRYAFFRGDEGALPSSRSPLGRFRTAWPDDWAAPLTVGASTCTHFRFMPYTALSRTAAEPVDLFVHLGDVSYNDGATSLADFRANYQRTLKDPGYRALLGQVGWYPIWDDHEFFNNFDPEQIPPALFATARGAFYEALPVEPAPDGRLWRSYRWGRTAELFVLDSRTERRPSTRETPDATYLSQAQLAWLQRGLARSTAHFKLVLNSVPIAAFPGQLWAALQDRWQGYPAQREALLASIDDIPNVWFLTGDFHLGLVHRVEREGPRRRLWEIAVGPGGNGNNPAALLWESTPENKELAFPKAQFEFCTGTPAATTLTLDPAADAVTVRFLDPASGDVRFEKTLRQEE